MEALAEYGLVGTILLGIFVAVGWLARKLFPILERVVDSHLDYVDHAKRCHEESGQRLCDHIDAEEADRDVLKRVGRHGCQVMGDVADKLNLSDESREHIAAIRHELESM
jgi:hypothetical protein